MAASSSPSRCWTPSLLPEPEAPSPEQRALVLETLHEIDAMLDALPPIVRTTFLLSQLDGMTYGDIAVHLKVSLTSVKRYMAQAFRQAVEAGRGAFEAGVMAPQAMAVASTPVPGHPFLIP